jgi:hypothetical protein
VFVCCLPHCAPGPLQLNSDGTALHTAAASRHVHVAEWLARSDRRRLAALNADVRVRLSLLRLLFSACPGSSSVFLL